MARNKDNSTIPNTCPKIDEVISFLTNLEVVEEWNELKATIALMEEIRGANSELRTWGNEEYNERNSREYELNEVNKTIEELKSEIESQNKYIQELENQ